MHLFNPHQNLIYCLQKYLGVSMSKDSTFQEHSPNVSDTVFAGSALSLS